MIAFLCLTAAAIDGDTIRCRNPGGTVNVRLARVDAPELPGHCRRGRACAPGDPFAAWLWLGRRVNGRDLRGELVDADPRRAGFQRADRYGRPVVRFTVDGQDLGQALIAAGHAVPWP